MLLGLLPFLVVGWQSTEIAPGEFVRDLQRTRPFFRGLLAPKLLAREREDITAQTTVFTPCGEADDPTALTPLHDDQPSVRTIPACAPLGEAIEVTGSGFPAQQPIELVWQNPGREQSVFETVQTDAAGGFSAVVTVPVESIPVYARRSGQPETPQRQALIAAARGAPGAVGPSPTLLLVLEAIGVTIALGFMATLIGACLALPLSVLGARNMMSGNAATLAVYGAARTFMNVTRSIEPLILVVVAVVWVGQGPFAGMIALTVHTIAAVGKLYSESIESIDPGPVDAVRATGANWLQQVAYAVFPQVVPPFIAFTVYRFDINVRMSTILGFVGGGGIGFLLQQWIFQQEWSEAATAVLVLGVIVFVLDFTSAELRQRVVAGRPLISGWRRAAAALLIIGFTIWTWNTVQMAPLDMIQSWNKTERMRSELLAPRLFVRGEDSQAASAPLVVPCDAVDPLAPLPAPEAGPHVELAVGCAAVGDSVRVIGRGFRPEATGVLRWPIPDSGALRATEIRTDDRGRFEAHVEVRPLLADTVSEHEAPVYLQAEVSWSVGGLRPSQPLERTASLLVETVLMALMATIFGAALALPLSLLGARNLMPRTAPGNALYVGSRTVMNALRSIEPLIVAAMFVSWVGLGPFAGMLALTVVTVANLGKLFSEAVESIDPGPIEAVEATGANRLQTMAYGVIPQVIPPFLAFGIYHWDINVRLSTIIGFVGGGGIGLVLRRWMNQLDWSAAAVGILGIVLVVVLMDYVSARVREALV